ncbi:MAG TPA: MBL fold metallo-hydrolase [Phycisphaerae bacterium]|nr:MBL fold metallo-hydrolase [Phycisphaerae bacterium]
MRRLFFKGSPVRRLAIAAAVMLVGSGCAEIQVTGPRLRILGTVQDGGLPHVGCWCSNCQAARASPSRRRYVSSVALILPRPSGHPSIYLIDATPDLRSQLDLLHDVRPGVTDGIDRSPVDGVFLTHAHIGHYLGLAFFGYEALNTSNLPVYCTPRMADFLRTNGPWSQLVRIGNVQLQTLEQRRPVRVPVDDAKGDHVLITPLTVPHRDEYSDTVGFIIRREHRENEAAGSAVLFVPDTEPWERWNPSLLKVIEQYGVNVAILDGTFYSGDELPDRGTGKIGHPLMKDTMDLLEPLVRAGRLTVYFTHLNHSNPALDPASPASREIRRRGIRVAKEGMELPL